MISAAVPVTVAADVAFMVPLVLTAAIADNVLAAILPLSFTVIASFPRPLRLRLMYTEYGRNPAYYW